MQKFQDPATGEEWHFEDGVNPYGFPRTPKNLTASIVPRPSEFHNWNPEGICWELSESGVKEQHNIEIQTQINALEAQITNRRIREYIAGIDTSFIPNIEISIENLRGQLQV